MLNFFRNIFGPQVPTFNHTRSDGFYNPCPTCAKKMTKEELLLVILDLQATIDSATNERISFN